MIADQTREVMDAVIWMKYGVQLMIAAALIRLTFQGSTLPAGMITILLISPSTRKLAKPVLASQKPIT